MNTDIITNEWLSVDEYRVPIDRGVFVRTVTGALIAAKWNGLYWVSYNSNSGKEMRGRKVTHFYVFERHPYDMGQCPDTFKKRGGFDI